MRAADALAAFRALPVASLDAIAPGPFVVLAPHPDDESLGCGGLIAQARARDIEVHVAILTDGTGSHPGSEKYPSQRLAALRRQEALDAGEALGLDASRMRFLGARDTQAPQGGGQFDALTDALATLLRAAGADTLFSTWAHDPHGDHLAAHLVARAAARRTGVRLLSYPVWGWTLPPDHAVSHATGWRLDVSAQLAAKRRAIAAHRSQTTDLIDDDPGGFRLGDAFLDLFNGPHEVFLAA